MRDRVRDGQWYEGSSHSREQTCVSRIDLDINIYVRKLREHAARAE
jgi:hypothetical protein